MSDGTACHMLDQADKCSTVKRIAVIGNDGGGKSTLCRLLGSALDLPVYPIDRIQWQPGWVPTPPQEFDRRHTALLAQETWIIDGFGSPEAIRARFEAADMLIFGDHPRVGVVSAAKQQISARGLVNLRGATSKYIVTMPVLIEQHAYRAARQTSEQSADWA